MKSKNFDVQDPNPDIPALAKSLYNLNHHQALEFEIDGISKLLDFSPELFPNIPFDEKRKINVILKILAKFCHIAEDLAAYTLSFLIGYESEKDEILGVFKKIVKYNMGEITDFYTHIHERNLNYFAEFLAFPPPDMQDYDTKVILERSCETVKDILEKVASNYKELYGFYMAYKHGYRVIKGHLNGAPDIVAYIENDESQRYFEIYDADIMEIRKLSKQCSAILDCIFENHYQRNLHELRGSTKKVQIKTVIKGASKFKKEDLQIIYPTRGERLREEELISDDIYADLFAEEMENKNRGKIVAIDYDNKEIIAMDYNANVVVTGVHNRKSSGRVRIRRVGKGRRSGIRIW